MERPVDAAADTVEIVELPGGGVIPRDHYGKVRKAEEEITEALHRLRSAFVRNGLAAPRSLTFPPDPDGRYTMSFLRNAVRHGYLMEPCCVEIAGITLKLEAS